MAETLEWNALASKVAEFLGMEADTLQRETNIYDELGLDSLGMFSLGMYLMKAFAITLPLSEVAGISTLGDVYDALERFGEPKVAS